MPKYESGGFVAGGLTPIPSDIEETVGNQIASNLYGAAERLVEVEGLLKRRLQSISRVPEAEKDGNKIARDLPAYFNGLQNSIDIIEKSTSNILVTIEAVQL